MARKRVAETGRFVKAEQEAGDAPAGAVADFAVEVAGARVGAPRPRHCRTFARSRMAENMPAITAMLVAESRKGSLGHLKLLVQLCGMDKGEVTPKVKRRGKSLEAILMEGWEREKDNFEPK